MVIPMQDNKYKRVNMQQIFKIRHHLFGLILSLMLSLFSLQAQAATATASVGSTTVESGEIFRFRVSLDDLASREDLDLSPLDKDFTYGRLQFGNSRYSINGTVTRQSEWNMTLTTNKTGQVVIPSLDINGVKTQPITLNVTQGAPLPDVKDLVEVENSIDKTELYLGETAKLTTKLFIKTNPYSLQDPDLTAPQSDDVDIKAIGQQNQLRTVIDGIDTIMVTQDYQVSPNASGDIEIAPIRLKTTIIQRDNQGRQRMIPVDIAADPIKLTVHGKPSDYQGAWLPTSSLSLMQTWTDSQGKPLDSSKGVLEAKVGTPITRTIRLRVKDLNADKFPSLAIYYPQGVRVYDEKPKFDRDAKGYTMMTLKQVVMPRSAGKVSLPDVEIPWWDTNSQSKQMAQVDGVELNIAPDPNAPAQDEQTNSSQTQPAPVSPEQPSQANQNLNEAAQPDQTQAAPSQTENSQTTDNLAPQDPSNSIHNAGIWPWTTALFGALFIWITGMYFAQKRKLKQAINVQSVEQVTPDSDLQALETALSRNNGTSVSLWVKNYIAKQSLTDAQKANIQQALDAVMHDVYAKGEPMSDANKAQLLERIKQSQAAQSKANQDVDLAKL